MLDSPKGIVLGRVRKAYQAMLSMGIPMVASTDAMLEIAATTVRMDDSNGLLSVYRTASYHVQPFEGANIEQSALEFTGIDPYHPFRMAKPEKEALEEIFKPIRKLVKNTGCSRAIRASGSILSTWLNSPAPSGQQTNSRAIAIKK